MEVAYAYHIPPTNLTRVQTAPAGTGTEKPGGGGGGRGTKTLSHQSLAHSQGHTSSKNSIQSQPSSRSSDTTQGTSTSTLFPPPLPPNAATMVGSQYGEVTATDNVMNSVATVESSLFKQCVSLRQRLHGVPDFTESLDEEEEDADDDTDPVTLLWRTFRRGYPLILLYNALRPNQPLGLSADVREHKRGKASTFKFLQACVNDLKFPQEECFIITDLYGDDTTGFVKVTKVVNRVLDILVQRGLIEDVRPTASDFEQAEKGMKRTQRQHIVSELVTTERTYVQHLELLQSFKHLVESKGVIPGDAIHDIFLNLNSLLDFQRRFLIRVEQTNFLPEDDQNWGKLFVLYSEAFKVYEPYIANQKKCERTVVEVFPKLAAGLTSPSSGASIEMRQIVESQASLYGFLMKPFQRLSKYPLLLEDLYKKGDLSEERRDDLLVGKEAAAGVLTRTNKAVDREEKAEAVKELKVRVEDWKGHRVEGFGELLLYGSFTVLKSEGAIGKDGERQVSILSKRGAPVVDAVAGAYDLGQYHVYLFETILLCCKDIDLSKPKNKLSNKQLVDKRGKPKLQLKGRIFMQNVTDLLSLGKPGTSAAANINQFVMSIVSKGNRIFWKGDPSIENFIIRFTTEEMMKRWAHQIEAQRRRYKGGKSPGSERLSGSTMTTSATEFEFMRNQPQMENPYKTLGEEEEEEEDVDMYAGYQRELGQGSRNASQTSLRSRSTTGDSGGMSSGATVTQARQPHPRYPPGGMPGQQGPPLSLRTRELSQTGTQSPAEYPPADSYFSPTEQSPSQLSSSRTSASSGMYPFPTPMSMPRSQPGMPMANGAYPHQQPYDDAAGHRYTAPAIARQREPSGGSGNYQQRAARPGLHSAQQMPGGHRNRSASSPDIHNQPRGPVKIPPTVMAGQVSEPPVPDMPAHYSQQYGNLPGGGPMRSQSNSPSLGQMVNGVMPPSTAQRMSPQMLRERGMMAPAGQGRGPPLPHQQMQQQMYGGQGPSSRTTTPVPPNAPQRSETFSPPIAQQEAAPTQLRVKVNCPMASQMLTLVVPASISYQSLKDRIDAKLQRSANMSLSADTKGTYEKVKLKFLDEDDYVSIQSDEDVQTAFETWREQNGGGAAAGGGMGEVELFCQK